MRAGVAVFRAGTKKGRFELIEADLAGLKSSVMSGESDSVDGNLRVAVYYAARSFVEVPAPAITGAELEVTIPLSIIPRRLATVAPGHVLRIQFRGSSLEHGPLLNATVTDKAKALGQYQLKLRILDWDKLARYWRTRIENSRTRPRSGRSRA
jgi:hypothetical protein